MSITEEKRTVWLTKRGSPYEPDGALSIPFINRDGDYNNKEGWGMFNFGTFEEEMSNLKNGDKIIINSPTINIHFPVFDYFYVMLHQHGPFTLADILINIKLTGEYAFITGGLGEYAITSFDDDDDDSDIKYKDNNIYVRVQH